MHTISRPQEPHNKPSPAGVAHVAVAGATGYAGQELLRLLARHPGVSIAAAMSSGTASASTRPLPALAHLWDGAIQPLSHDALRAADLVFLALPDTAAAELAPMLADAGVRVIDLSGAFRLRDQDARARWYPDTRQVPAPVAYGLTERERGHVRGAQLVANPGCYPTAALLALAPLVDAGFITPASDVIVDAKSGVSGAGKSPTERNAFFRSPWQPGGLRRLQPSARRRNRAGARARGHVHAAPGAARPRHSLDDLRTGAGGHDRSRVGRRADAGLRRRDVRATHRIGAAGESSTSCTPTSAISAGGSTPPEDRLDARFWCR
jgi:hypothetical protein